MIQLRSTGRSGMASGPRTESDMPADGRSGIARARLPLAVAVLLAAIAVVSALSVLYGSRVVTMDDVMRAFADPAAHDIAAEAVRLRMPRTVLGLLIGAALGLAGAVMQGVARNPLADPSILGLNAGAAFAIVLSIAVAGLDTPIEYMAVALMGCALTAVAVWILGSMGRSGPTPLKLTLAGAVLASVLGSLTSAVMLPRVDVISAYRYWQVGGLAGARFSLMGPIIPFLVAGTVLCVMSARALNVLALGDHLAVGLGMNVMRMRVMAWVGTVLLCAGATSLAGPIGFVGLIVPHAARLMVGPDYRRIMALSVLLGALLLVCSDVIGRVVSRPDDVQVGIVTALVGAPVFVALVRRRKIAQV